MVNDASGAVASSPHSIMDTNVVVFKAPSDSAKCCAP